MSILTVTLLITIPTCLATEQNSYFADNNTCVVYPSGIDDTLNLVQAFEMVSKDGLRGTVKLLEGTYYISYEVSVVNFDGVFRGAGIDQTIVRTNGT